MPVKYIIDVDTGVDDAQAIMLALSRPDIDVIAITCVAGNVGVDQVCINTLKALSICGRLDVPVYRGCNTPLVGEGIEATHYHGNDGLGDADLDIEVSLDRIQKEPAVSALLRLVNENPGDITLVALAPLTNIALALKQDPDFGKKLKRISIMGGNTQATGRVSPCAEFNFYCDPEAAYTVLDGIQKIYVNYYEQNAGLSWLLTGNKFILLKNSGKLVRLNSADNITEIQGKKTGETKLQTKNFARGRGNSTLCGEFNFACDPDSAYVVLNELSVPVTLCPWELNLTSASGQPWEWFDQWIETDTPKGRFNKAVTKLAVYRQRVLNKYPIYRSCDLNAIATVIDPKIVLETKDVFATVELHGKYTRGMMVVDWRGSLGKSPNVTLVDKIDTSLARPLFENMLK